MLSEPRSLWILVDMRKRFSKTLCSGRDSLERLGSDFLGYDHGYARLHLSRYACMYVNMIVFLDVYMYVCMYFIFIVGSIICSEGLPLTPLHAIGSPVAYQLRVKCVEHKLRAKLS